VGGAVRLLVVADDLGYDPAIDEGILEAHAEGIVTAASAMVDGPFAAASIGRAPATLGLGLHLVLAPGTTTGEAALEARRQIARFEDLRGAPPSHLDGHKHVHAEPQVLTALLSIAAARGLRVRALDEGMRDRLRRQGVPTTDRFLGDAGLRPCWTTGRLLETLEGLGAGSTELMCHPGRPPTHARTSFGAERMVERDALCDPRVRTVVRARGILLARGL
jgi:predicted glycoside hydrolase/deacetylase ChbG (UPF0249 family)